MRWSPGRVLIGIGLLHQTVGLAAGAGLIAHPGSEGRRLLMEIARAGVVGSIEPDPQRETFFWFVFFGFALLALGWALDRWEASGVRLPAAAGWQLVALAVGGGLLIPASGFWLALGPGAWLIARARRAPAP